MGRFELHCHSHYSRGSKIPCEGLPSPGEIVRSAKARGLSGVAITDHGNIMCWRDAREEAGKQGILFIPAMEIDSSAGHIIGLGLTEGVRNGLCVGETADKIREQGGVAVAAHPFDMRGFGIKNRISLVDVVEVFNAMNLDRISNVFSESRAGKAGKPGIAGSDAHSLDMIGIAANSIRARDLESVLKNVRKGRVSFERNYVPMDVVMEWIRERFIRSYGDVLVYINKNYSPPKAWLARKLMRRFVLSRSPFWDMLWGFSMSMSTLYSGFRLLSYY